MSKKVFVLGVALMLASGLAMAQEWGAEVDFGPTAVCGQTTNDGGSIFVGEPEIVDFYFYDIPARYLVGGAQEVQVDVALHGQPVATETFTLEAQGSKDVILALFANDLGVQKTLRDLFRTTAKNVSIQVNVGGSMVIDESLANLVGQREKLLQRGVLPTAVISESATYDFTVPELPNKFYVCGDGTCSPGGVFGEDCETCPQDCGGSCSICGNGYCGPQESCSTCSADCGACPSCPTSLGTENRVNLTNSQYQGLSCLKDVFNPSASTYYNRYYNTYYHYQVERIRECDGSITENVVPGSGYYSYNTCYQRTSFSCSFAFIYPSCWY